MPLAALPFVAAALHMIQGALSLMVHLSKETLDEVRKAIEGAKITGRRYHKHA